MPYSPLANPRATKGVLQEFGLSAKHALGQNFLVDDNVIGNILRLARIPEPGADGELSTLLEIGPGIGTLTLASNARGSSPSSETPILSTCLRRRPWTFPIVSF